MKRAAVVFLSVVGLLLSGITYLYFFGTPQAPAPYAAYSEAAPGAGTGLQDAEAVAAEATADEGRPPLAIEIPGCVCHSDDPKQVQAHAKYRINECTKCHSGGSPMMGR